MQANTPSLSDVRRLEAAEAALREAVEEAPLRVQLPPDLDSPGGSALAYCTIEVRFCACGLSSAAASASDTWLTGQLRRGAECCCARAGA